MNRPSIAALVLVLSIFGTSPGPAAADPPRFDLGLRFDAVAAGGEPTNDVLGLGLFGHYRLAERWWIGLAFDRSEDFDVERPYEFLGLVGDPVAGELDAAASSTALTAWIERRWGRPGGRLGWFVAGGGGFADVSVEDLTGPLAGGGAYDITQEVGTETLLTGGGGVRIRFGGRWVFEAAARLDQHLTDWTVTDRVSGRSVSLDDYTVRGVHLGLSVEF